MALRFSAYVGNIGLIGEYADSEQALDAVLTTIANSARADNYGYVTETNGCQVEIAWEYGQSAD